MKLLTVKCMSILTIAALLAGGNALAQDFKPATFDNSKKVTEQELYRVVRSGVHSGSYLNTNDLPRSKFDMYVYRDLVISPKGYASLDLADSLSLKSELLKDKSFYKDILGRHIVSIPIKTSERQGAFYTNQVFEPATDLATGQPIAVRIPLRIQYSVEVKGNVVSVNPAPGFFVGGHWENKSITCGKQMRFDSDLQEMLATSEFPVYDTNLSDEHLDHIFDAFATYAAHEWKIFWVESFNNTVKKNPEYFYNENESKEQFEARTESVVSDYVAHKAKNDFLTVYSKESIKKGFSTNQMCMLESLVQHPKFFAALDDKVLAAAPELVEDIEMRKIHLLISLFSPVLRKLNNFIYSKECNQRFSGLGNMSIALSMLRSPNNKEKLFAEIYGRVAQNEQFSNIFSTVFDSKIEGGQKKEEAKRFIQLYIEKYCEEQLYTDLAMTILKKDVDQVTEEQLNDFNARWLANSETMQKMTDATLQSLTDFIPILKERFDSESDYSKKIKAASCSKDYKKKFASVFEIPKVTVEDVKAKMGQKVSYDLLQPLTRISNSLIKDYKTLLLNSYIAKGITLEELDIIDEFNKHPVTIAMNVKKSGTDFLTQGTNNGLSNWTEPETQELLYRTTLWYAVNIKPLLEARKEQ